MSDAPAWKQRTEGESRWAAVGALTLAAAAQLVLPHSYPAIVRFGTPAIVFALAIGSLVIVPNRIDGHTTPFRAISLSMVGLLALANAVSLAILVDRLVAGDAISAAELLQTGFAVWLTNTVAFGLAYWEFDRGGPGRRSEGVHDYPDFNFPQMQNPELAPPDWEPVFVDYLYVSVTNATAFSPTDTMPMSRWAKMMMLVQSVISLVTVALVIARAVNVFR
ncbi:MAG: DUF1345 domain-containing protein [Actinobacteria bacterium]|nr:DUF1345 domain-containing protein [Actinomycetota bacterium]